MISLIDLQILFPEVHFPESHIFMLWLQVYGQLAVYYEVIAKLITYNRSAYQNWIVMK